MKMLHYLTSSVNTFVQNMFGKAECETGAFTASERIIHRL